jgi:multimeric flavodoxin WrbA
MKKIILIQASSRSYGNTNKIALLIQKRINSDLLDLNMKQFTGYDYESKNKGDDFLGMIKDIVENYDLIIFLTPVYWYSMSGLLKNFLDRLTDCLKIEKAIGRKLRGKSMIAISCGSDNNETKGFFVPFRKTAEYLGMHYLGDLHTWVDGEKVSDYVKNKVNSFIVDNL